MREDEALGFVIDELTRLIEIPSVSDQEHEAMRHLADRCRRLDLPVDEQPVPGAGPNLVVGWDVAPTLLLTAHIDTIVPMWQTDHRASVDGTIVSGLGAQDDKGCAVAILLAMLMARDEGVPVERLPVALGFCVDEEVGGKGSRAMADSLRPPFVIASEGTEFDVAVTETGFVEGWVRIPGRSMHGSLIEEADNPLLRAAGLIQDLGRASFTRLEHPIAGRNMVTVLQLLADQRSNATPEEARMLISARVFEEPSLADVAGELSRLCAEHGAVFDEIDRGGWWETPWEAPLVRTLVGASERAIGRTPRPTRMPAWTDAHSFHDRSDSEVVVYGPGHLRTAHRPDEHIDAADIVRAARVMAGVIGDVGQLQEARTAMREGDAP
ncbi:MAG: M20/M25/M40 family metallo-hydrolase [Actinomycetota bacterium]